MVRCVVDWFMHVFLLGLMLIRCMANVSLQCLVGELNERMLARGERRIYYRYSSAITVHVL